MEMRRVNSRAISAVGYDPTTRRMKIRFTEGKIYDFCNVPQAVFDGLLRAASKGKYYDVHIRDGYQCI